MKEFQYSFVVDRGTLFNVAYYTLGSNKSAHFSTSAAVFNRPRTDYNQCGQCQQDVLKSLALRFFKKWDRLHLKDLSAAHYAELLRDLEQLKKTYPHFVKTDGENIRLSDEVAAERAYRGVTL